MYSTLKTSRKLMRFRAPIGLHALVFGTYFQDCDKGCFQMKVFGHRHGHRPDYCWRNLAFLILTLSQHLDQWFTGSLCFPLRTSSAPRLYRG
jgi:hypothetical protein